MRLKKPNNQRLFLAIAVSLTLGLAPFTPEPHLWSKLRWVIGGAEGMQIIDYFDLVLHGAPFMYLLTIVIAKLIRR
jgi:hypothetical protein